MKNGANKNVKRDRNISNRLTTVLLGNHMEMHSFRTLLKNGGTNGTDWCSTRKCKSWEIDLNKIKY